MNFRYKIKEILENNRFFQFDIFIVQKMLGREVSNPSLAERKHAWRIFWNQIGKVQIVTLPTMKRWFGIGGIAVPSRFMVYEICFLLRADSRELREYLTLGLAEPDVQWSDYREMIYLYGLEHNLDFKKCNRLIKQFEYNMDLEPLVEQTAHTRQLEEGYIQNCDMQEDDFFLWMIDNARYFKGYSKTSLEYFQKYKTEVCSYVRRDALKRLHILLKETDYDEWMKGRKKASEKKQIEQYLKRNVKRKENCISDILADDIRQLSKTAFCPQNTNSMLLTEVWFTDFSRKRERSEKSFYNVTAKHLTDVLQVAQKKEQAICLASLKSKLESLPVNKCCPETIRWKLLEDYNMNCHTVREALECIDAVQKEAKRRQLLVQRRDLLPMVLYVAQQQYLEQLKQGELYDYQEARNLFCRMANSVMTACQMAELQESFQLDVILLACYQKEAMYEYSDVLEVLYECHEEKVAGEL